MTHLSGSVDEVAGEERGDSCGESHIDVSADTNVDL